MMLTSEIVKEKAKELGADLVGIGDMSLFEGTPAHRDPRYIAPAAKSIIALGFRILRGAFRGIESGTQFYQLPTMGAAHIDMRYAPGVLRRLACFLEDNGWEGTVQMAVNDRRQGIDYAPNPEMHETHRIDAEPVAADRPAPDVIIDHNQAAYICGLGEMGDGGFFLTPEFGPFQRFAFILTDAPLGFDQVKAQRSICDSCGICLTACPGGAIIEDRVTRRWAGNDISYYATDPWQCAAYHAGAHTPTNPFARDDLFADLDDGDIIAHGRKRLSRTEAQEVKRRAETTYGGVGDNYNACICGKSCLRECFLHLESTGALTRKFRNPFRVGEPWKIDRPSAG